jgi:thiosulfate reductase cytochrome b subunit
MTTIAEGPQPMLQQPGIGMPRTIGAWLSVAAGVLAIALGLVLWLGNGVLASWGVGNSTDPAVIAAFGAAGFFMLLGGLGSFSRPGLGGGVALAGWIVYIAALLLAKSFGYALAVPLVLGFAGSLTTLLAHERSAQVTDTRLVYRQAVLTRITHWVWAIAMFFLVLTGLQIWNAHPALYIGHESGFEYDNAILRIGAENTPEGPRGFTTVFGQKFDTTGVLGMSGPEARPQFVGFPPWATIPSFRDLATGRVIHFFFAWILVGALAIWLISSLANGHLWRDIILKPRDFRELPRDILDHVRLRFHHTTTYSPLQKFAYFAVFVVLFPLIILTGLTMSPGMNAAWPWLVDVFGGRQTARTLHFLAMVGFVLFFVVHIVMVVLAGPINELRSMITGYYRTSANREPRP